MRLAVLLGLLFGFFYIVSMETPQPSSVETASALTDVTQRQGALDKLSPRFADVSELATFETLFPETFDADAKSQPMPVSLLDPDLDFAALIDDEKAEILTKPVSDIRFVSGTIVNVRSGPSTSFQVVGQLKYGAKVSVNSESTGAWFKITYANGSTGWMSQKYLSPDIPAKINTAIQQAPPQRTVSVPSGAAVRQAKNDLIRQSLAAYPGSCACPYNSDRAGRRCGGRSAWSRPGGYAPICYSSDVTDSLLANYFSSLRRASN